MYYYSVHLFAIDASRNPDGQSLSQGASLQEQVRFFFAGSARLDPGAVWFHRTMENLLEPAPKLQLILECKTALVQLVGRHFEQGRGWDLYSDTGLLRDFKSILVNLRNKHAMDMDSADVFVHHWWVELPSRQPRTESACESTGTRQTAACESSR